MKPTYRVMVVDDSATMRTALRTFLEGLERASFEVFEADNGAAALKALSTADGIDLVVTDLDMPQMDGLQLIRYLRQTERYAELPILFLTAHDEDEKKAEIFRLGATDYVVKPFLAPELEARIMGYLERKRAFETILEHERALRSSIEQARSTQKALLPAALPRIVGARLAVKFDPAEHLAGDYYDFFALPGAKVGIVLADVAGHGLGAALVSFLVAGILKNNAGASDDPAAVLRTSHAMLAGKIPEGRYATAFYAVFDPQARSLTYASAGHPAALLVRPGADDVHRLTVEGTPFGLPADGDAQYERGEAHLEDDDAVLFHTDGLTETEADGQHPLGFLQLKRFLLEHTADTPQARLDGVHTFGLQCTGRQRYGDDLTLILLEMTNDAA